MAYTPSPFLRSGWTASGLLPNPDLHAQALGTLSTPQSLTGTNAGTSGLPEITANDLKTGSVALNDPKLASRAFTGVPTGFGTIAAQTGVGAIGGSANIPAWLQGQLSDLNALQKNRSNLYQSILSPVFKAQADYLGQLGAGFKDITGAQVAKTKAQTSAIQSAQSVQTKLADLQRRRDQLMSQPGSTSAWGGPSAAIQDLDKQISTLHLQAKGTSGTQRLGQSAAISGWSPITMPGIPALPKI